ncbi:MULTISPECIES: LysM peptidoglycan-binding domain-containing protein [Marinobacter]|uniref:LysM peptidoglycan-binding domain-containing protein n=1 Tax=Marinobacter xiaoshiensis TaxID=3073652 RepID=A0ABU2HF47_9GAMM|nr:MULTISPECIES: LysM peptidoglycan-binding domain-containing protein [unclassified Marinobacter]MBK1872496.1 LysM peptidoglycan-binding domain-containing protein [Marinobacter sp. 1-3A]MBK1887387.1 LysM peptidoglycan-binding domain-containing protein [Marinobacter sp. DY40_1A1]MDS1308970.1 LysM peptidoglycan-binding domain-containing protein [Marinobacter sp. F60267]
MRKLLYALAATTLLLTSWAHAAPELRSDHPERYTVVKGDTLWDISGRFLSNPWYWPEIWHVNPQVANPHLIYPGDRLALVYIDGKPRVTKVTSNNGVVKLSPQVRSERIDTPIPAIPLDAISSFLTDTRVVTPEQIDAAPYILEGKDARIVLGAGDRVYARGKKPADKVGVFRRSQEFVDPDTGEFLGLEARSIARGDISAENGEVLTLDLTRSSEEVRIGDRLLVNEDRRLTTSFVPSSPAQEIEGKMMSVDGGVTQIGQYNVVTINRGAREGLEAGNVMAILKSGNLARDPVTNETIELPSERAGLLMVFQVYEKMSYGLILQATRPLSVGDKVTNP